VARDDASRSFAEPLRMTGPCGPLLTLLVILSAGGAKNLLSSFTIHNSQFHPLALRYIHANTFFAAGVSLAFCWRSATLRAISAYVGYAWIVPEIDFSPTPACMASASSAIRSPARSAT